MRKIAFYAVLVTALSLLLVLGVAAEKVNPPAANALSAAGAVSLAPVPAGPAAAPATLINDGSFENGPPPGSAWTEVTNSTCEWIGDWSGVWGVPAYDGSMDFWGGGYCGGTPTTSSVSQAGIAVPGSDNDLHFWYIAYRPDADDGDNDRAYLNVNGSPVWTLPLLMANNTYPAWVEVVVPLAAYANQNVTLEFGGISEGASTGNIRFDYISIGEPPPPPERCAVGYHAVTLLTEAFEGAFPPAGWSVSNSSVGCAGVPEWTNTDPGARGNLTGGSGLFAIADSDQCGSGVTVMDTQMSTPQFNLTNYTDARVGFRHDVDFFTGSETVAFDVSTDAGSTWANVNTWTANATGAYESPNLPGAGQNDVLVRWHYVAGWDWWWQVDDVIVTACEPDTPTAVDVSAIDASPVAPLASVPWAVVPAALAAAAGAVWVARRRR